MDDVRTQPHHGPAGRRLLALDVLRGLAILGTLLTNIWIFAGSGVSGLDDLGSTGAEGTPQVGGVFAEVVDQGMGLVTDGKWIGLLTIMFGIGLEIQRRSAIRRGDSWPGTYPWRAGLLIVEGTLNYLSIFEFDVLMGYGLTGLVVAAVLATSPRAQKIWLGVGLGLHLLVIGGFVAVMGLAGGLAAEEDTPEASAAFWDDLDALPGEPSREQLRMVAAEHGLGVDRVRELADSLGDPALGVQPTDSYWAMVVERAENFLLGRGEIPFMLTMGLGLFLIGAMLYRRGLFAPEGARLRVRVMAFGFLLGLPLDVVCRIAWPEQTGG